MLTFIHRTGTVISLAWNGIVFAWMIVVWFDYKFFRIIEWTVTT